MKNKKAGFMRCNLHHYVLIGLLSISTSLCAEVLIVVGAKSNLTSLSKNQVKDIFLGRVTSLPNGSLAIPLDRLESNPLREEFYFKVTNQTAAQVKAHWAKLYFTGRGVPPKEVGDSAEIKKMLNALPAAISYIDRAALDSAVKVIFSEP